jgi:hypothetical protein
METDTVPMPHGAHRLKIGETLRVWLRYCVSYSYDSYTGEHDADLELYGMRTLRKQKRNTRKWRRKYFE